MDIQAGQLITDGTVTWMVEDTRDGNRVGDIVLRHILRPGYVKANGAVLQVADYPRLVQYVEEYNLSVTEAQWTALLTGKYVLNKTAGTLRVPDLRGRFLRALSDGGGLDNGRVLGSYQGDAMRNFTGYTAFCGDENGSSGVGPVSATGVFYGSGSPVAYTRDADGWRAGSTYLHIDPSRVVPTAAENRPVNTAYIAQIKY